MVIQQKFYMEKALRQAQCALEEDEVPVGAIIVYKNQIIAKAYNQVERLKDPTAHAEMIAITQATNFLGSKWINDCTLYVTVEPCSMCAGALVLSRIANVVFGADDPKTGAFGSKININNLGLNHRIKVKKGLLKEECVAFLKEFFRNKRKPAKFN
ncbi:MAG: tRNA adenosine(34) deaminase TadA [Candidatus Omnitrophica bacterium]|jgi:tRNA(adenine34) deaminase|nr:tRNA adenosine(34) deaminase TadA [Candidatus Omnitrophota bacterium]